MLKTKHKQQFCYFPSSACKDSPGLFRFTMAYIVSANAAGLGLLRMFVNWLVIVVWPM